MTAIELLGRVVSIRNGTARAEHKRWLVYNTKFTNIFPLSLISHCCSNVDSCSVSCSPQICLQRANSCLKFFVLKDTDVVFSLSFCHHQTTFIPGSTLHSKLSGNTWTLGSTLGATAGSVFVSALLVSALVVSALVVSALVIPAVDSTFGWILGSAIGPQIVVLKTIVPNSWVLGKLMRFANITFNVDASTKL